LLAPREQTAVGAAGRTYEYLGSPSFEALTRLPETLHGIQEPTLSCSGSSSHRFNSAHRRSAGKPHLAYVKPTVAPPLVASLLQKRQVLSKAHGAGCRMGPLRALPVVAAAIAREAQIRPSDSAC
jgi:hypothetical protein